MFFLKELKKLHRGGTIAHTRGHASVMGHSTDSGRKGVGDTMRQRGAVEGDDSSAKSRMVAIGGAATSIIDDKRRIHHQR
jgi:hypothetical protein